MWGIFKSQSVLDVGTAPACEIMHTRQSCSNTAHPKCPQCGKNPTNRPEEEALVSGRWVCLKCGCQMVIYRVTRFITELDKLDKEKSPNESL